MKIRSSFGRLLFWAAVVCTAASCRRSEEWRPEGADGLRTVVLQLSVADPELPVSEPQAAASRADGALDATWRYEVGAARAGATPGDQKENAVRDLNLFLVHTSLGDRDVRFFYLPDLANPDGSSKVDNKATLKYLYNGKYRVYAVANNGAPLDADNSTDELRRSTKTEAQIKALATTSGRGYTLDNGLLMTAKRVGGKVPEWDLSAPSSDLKYAVPLVLERRVAKIYGTYVANLVFPYASDAFEARFLQINNRPMLLYPFADTPPAAVPANTVRLKSNPVVSGAKYGPEYVLESMPGNAPLVTTPQMRSAELAPAGAVYMFVDGYYTPNGQSQQRTGFQAYFGEAGQVSNFDLCGNRIYDMTVLVKGNNPSDRRVSTLDVKFAPLRDGETPDTKYQDLTVSYSNQFGNTFQLYYTDNSGGGFSKLQVEVKQPDGSYKLVSGRVDVCDPTKSEETNVPITLKITFNGSGLILVNIQDKYFRTLSSEPIDL